MHIKENAINLYFTLHLILVDQFLSKAYFSRYKYEAVNFSYPLFKMERTKEYGIQLRLLK